SRCIILQVFEKKKGRPPRYSSWGWPFREQAGLAARFRCALDRGLLRLAKCERGNRLGPKRGLNLTRHWITSFRLLMGEGIFAPIRLIHNGSLLSWKKSQDFRLPERLEKPARVAYHASFPLENYVGNLR